MWYPCSEFFSNVHCHQMLGDCLWCNRVQQLAVMLLMLVRSWLSTVIVPHHTTLDTTEPISILPVQNLSNSLLTCHICTLCFVDGGHHCSHRMSKPELVLNHDSHIMLLNHILKCFQWPTSHLYSLWTTSNCRCSWWCITTVPVGTIGRCCQHWLWSINIVQSNMWRKSMQIICFRN